MSAVSPEIETLAPNRSPPAPSLAVSRWSSVTCAWPRLAWDSAREQDRERARSRIHERMLDARGFMILAPEVELPRRGVPQAACTHSRRRAQSTVSQAERGPRFRTLDLGRVRHRKREGVAA